MATVIESIGNTALGGTTRTTFQNFMKDDYFPMLNEWVHTGVTLPKLIAKVRGKMGGKKSISCVVTALPQSSGVARGERWKLPTPRSTVAANPEIISRDNYWRLRWTGKVMSSARKGNAVAWAKPQQIDLEMAREQFQQNYARQLYLGPWDTFAEIKTHALVGGVSKLTLHGLDDRTSTAASFAKFGAYYLRQNMSVAIVKSASGMGGAPAWSSTSGTTGEAMINAAPDDSDPDNPFIVLDVDAVATAVANGGTYPEATGLTDWLIPYASRVDSSINGDAAVAISQYWGPNGLNNICLDETIYPALFGLAKTSYDGLTGSYYTNSGTTRAFSERLVELMTSRARNRSGSVMKKLLLSDTTMREITKENRGDRRFMPVIKTGGYEENLGVHFGDMQMPYVADHMAPPGIIYGINPEDFGWYEEWPLQSIDEGSDKRFVQDYDMHELIARMSGNLSCDRPFAQGALDDLTYSAYNLTV